MRKQTVIPFLLAAFLWASCEESPRTIEAKADKVMKKVEDKAEKLADSAKEKLKDVRNHLDTTLND